MEKIKNSFKWIFRNFFFITIVISILTDIRSFWLMPRAGDLIFTLIWVLINIFIVVAFRIFTSRTCLGRLFLAISIFFLCNEYMEYFLQCSGQSHRFCKV